uniref:LacI family protein n=1 Tax=Bacillus subtilis subsp. natto TaxID=86029 RepID=E9RJC7_BACNA|nr:lacI family protein [Bacillus subtilis subsp. natto]
MKMFKSKLKKVVGMGIITTGLFISALPAGAITEYVWIRDVPEYQDAYDFVFDANKKEVTLYFKGKVPKIVKCDKVQNGMCYVKVEK